MGHLAGKDIYKELGRKIDNLTVRSPMNDSLFAILKELYTAEEAEVIVKMPFGISTIEKIAQNVSFKEAHLRKLLDNLCDKGLVMDLWYRDHYRYMPSPMIVGIFEFTMMRTGGDLKTKEWAKMFHEYLTGDNSFYAANFKDGQKISPLRVLPYLETIADEHTVEVLDYEKAEEIISRVKRHAVGHCSCRHEKLHAGVKECDVPLEMCTSFNRAADYLISHEMAKEVSKEEIRDLLTQAKERELVLCADNVKSGVSFICLCCGCCCNVLQGITKFGFPNTVVTSNFIAVHDDESCAECGECIEVCPINAISDMNGGKREINEEICLGCGVCALRCSTGSMTLRKREQRVLYPENTFERVILQCLERGTLQNLIVNNPGKASHEFIGGLLGGFFRLQPVKRALMSETLRSRFLSSVKRLS